MAYNTDSTGSTLTDVERSQEAVRILTVIIGDVDYSTLPITTEAKRFLAQLRQQLDMFGEIAVSIKQLWYLRDIAGRIE